MGSTINFGFPYPDGGELIDAAAVGNLANALDSHLDDFESTSNPTMITMTLSNGWTAAIGGSAEPVRLYRMGRLVVMTGEVYWPPQSGVTHGQPVPTNKRTFMTLPVGWRPSTRVRQLAVRSPSTQTEVFIDQANDGVCYLTEAVCLNASPGYNISSQWITEA